MDARLKKLIVLAVALVVVFFLACVLPTNVFDPGRADKTIGTLAAETATAVQGFIGFFVDPNTMYGTYMLTVLVTLLAGAAMGLSGGVYQGALKNALASPSTLGVMSGAQFGGVLYLMLLTAGVISTGTVTGNTLLEQSASMYEGMNIFEYIWSVFEQGFFSLAGSTIVVAIVLGVSWLAGHGRSSRVALIVSGQVIAVNGGMYC